MSTLSTAINDYTASILLRYYRSATTVSLDKPALSLARDRELLRSQWAMSAPVAQLATAVATRPRSLQPSMASQLRSDDAVVRGRFDARATTVQRRLSGHPTLVVFHEPVRTFFSQPNYLVFWVLDIAWRLLGNLAVTIPDASGYGHLVHQRRAIVEGAVRSEPFRRISAEVTSARRPPDAAISAALRSRNPTYRQAALTYKLLALLEAGDEDALRTILSETLLGPQEEWRRLELAVGLGIAESLSCALQTPYNLTALSEGQEALAHVGKYSILWQARSEYYRAPTLEPTEEIIKGILSAFGLRSGADRPDLLIVDRDLEKVVAIVEVKSWQHESERTAAFRAAVEQLVRYARGYTTLDRIERLLGDSLVALLHPCGVSTPSPKPFGAPTVVDFLAIVSGALEPWAATTTNSLT